MTEQEEKLRTFYGLLVILGLGFVLLWSIGKLGQTQAALDEGKPGARTAPAGDP